MRMLVVRMLCREEIKARKSKENQGKPRKTKASNFKKYFEHVFVGFGRGDACFSWRAFHNAFVFRAWWPNVPKHKVYLLQSYRLK